MHRVHKFLFLKQFFFEFFFEFYRETAGGILGQVIGNYLESSMKLLGATTLLFFVWLASISLFLNVSWIKIIDEIGKYSLVFWEFCLSKIDEIKDKFEEKRKKAERKEIFNAEKKRIAKKAPPKIEPITPKLEKSNRAEKERQVPMFEPLHKNLHLDKLQYMHLDFS